MSLLIKGSSVQELANACKKALNITTYSFIDGLTINDIILYYVRNHMFDYMGEPEEIHGFEMDVHPITNELVPSLYNELDDHIDHYYYTGNETVDGTTFDKWSKYEEYEFDDVFLINDKDLLTNIIVKQAPSQHTFGDLVREVKNNFLPYNLQKEMVPLLVQMKLMPVTTDGRFDRPYYRLSEFPSISLPNYEYSFVEHPYTVSFSDTGFRNETFTTTVTNKSPVLKIRVFVRVIEKSVDTDEYGDEYFNYIIEVNPGETKETITQTELGLGWRYGWEGEVIGVEYYA